MADKNLCSKNLILSDSELLNFVFGKNQAIIMVIMMMMMMMMMIDDDDDDDDW